MTPRVPPMQMHKTEDSFPKRAAGMRRPIARNKIASAPRNGTVQKFKLSVSNLEKVEVEMNEVVDLKIKKKFKTREAFLPSIFTRCCNVTFDKKQYIWLHKALYAG